MCADVAVVGAVGGSLSVPRACTRDWAGCTLCTRYERSCGSSMSVEPRYLTAVMRDGHSYDSTNEWP